MKRTSAEELINLSSTSTASIDWADALITQILIDAMRAADDGEWSVEGRIREYNQKRYIKQQLEDLGYRVHIGGWDSGIRGKVMWPQQVGYRIKVSWGPRWWERK